MKLVERGERHRERGKDKIKQNKALAKEGYEGCSASLYNLWEIAKLN